MGESACTLTVLDVADALHNRYAYVSGKYQSPVKQALHLLLIVTYVLFERDYRCSIIINQQAREAGSGFKVYSQWPFVIAAATNEQHIIELQQLGVSGCSLWKKYYG